MNNIPGNPMPAGWVWTTLGEICHRPEYGWTTAAIQGGSSVRLLRTTDITKGYVDWTTVPFCREEPGNLDRYQLSPGDIVISRAGSVGVSALIGNCPIAVFASYLIRFRPKPPIDPRYVFYFSRSPEYWNAIAKSSAGIALQNVNARKLEAIPLPLAPLNEQRRIVTEVERQLTGLDAAVAALKRIQANLKRYRAAVLKAACEGRLVPTEAELARAEGRDYETGSQLLARILEERRARWEADQLAKTRAAIKPRKDDKWKARYQEPAAPGTTGLSELPEGWTWVTVDQLTSFEENAITDGPFGSNLKTSHYTATGPRVIRLQNIGDGVFVDAHAHISREHYESLLKHQVKAGDIVIASLGDRLPRACVIPLAVGPAIVKADCIRFSPESRLALTRYLNYALNAEPTRTRTTSSVHGVGRPRLGLGGIRAVVLPIPPVAEQERIVAEAERRLSTIDELNAIVETNLKRAERLRQSVLKSAFEGNLVPQDLNDEPATVLLERIRAEKAIDKSGAGSKVRKRSQGESKHVEEAEDRGKMSTKNRRSLFEVLKQAEIQLSPEQLFNQAGHTPDSVESFYEELRSEIAAGRIVQERPNSSEVILRVAAK